MHAAYDDGAQLFLFATPHVLLTYERRLRLSQWKRGSRHSMGRSNDGFFSLVSESVRVRTGLCVGAPHQGSKVGRS